MVADELTRRVERLEDRFYRLSGRTELAEARGHVWPVLVLTLLALIGTPFRDKPSDDFGDSGTLHEYSLFGVAGLAFDLDRTFIGWVAVGVLVGLGLAVGSLLAGTPVGESAAPLVAVVAGGVTALALLLLWLLALSPEGGSVDGLDVELTRDNLVWVALLVWVQVAAFRLRSAQT